MNETAANNARLLVADDEAVVTSLVRDALEEEGHTVDIASDGPSALELARQHTYDLVISDIRMPGMDGIELIGRIREMQPGVGVVFMTGYADLNSAKNAIKQGAIDYIMKPFELSEIRQAVDNGLRIRRDADELEIDQQIDHLSDLNEVLLAAGDQKSLVIASLKFVMMHQRTDRGTVIYWDYEQEDYQVIDIDDEQVTESALPSEPLTSTLKEFQEYPRQKACLISNRDEHPIYSASPNPDLVPYLFPSWMSNETPMIKVPVYRAGLISGFIMLKVVDDTVRIRESDIKVLSITASQLSISLENLSLLEESRKAYARLREVQDETIELEKMATRGEISAEIGHELNNFVGVVAGNLSLLDAHLGKGEHDKLGKYVTAMTETIEKIKSFTTNLMDLTPISSTRDIIHIDSLLIEVVDFLRPQKRYEDVEIRILPMPYEVPFEADATQIQQLLYNLFNNAADATKDCDTRKIVAGVDVNTEPSTFRLTVADTGMGIEPELLEKAFREKFTTKESGHGFGLIVCNQIIQQHGGELVIKSTKGKGTSISIEFPLADEITEKVIQTTSHHTA